VLAFPGAQILDITGPLEVFGCASRWMHEQQIGRGNGYAIEVVALQSGPFRTSSGLTMVADRALRSVRGGLDTLLIAGGPGVLQAAQSAPILAWTRRMASRVRRIGSVCTGAFVLGEAGLLAGLRATTHWKMCDALARRYPDVVVDSDSIFVRDGATYTSAGVTAGMDLALALVEEDHGRQVALSVARDLVMFLLRPGGQSQFSAQLAGQLATREPVQELQVAILAGLAGDLSVPALARRVGMSTRNFARVFTHETGRTPARFVESARVEQARRLLEETTDGVKTIASSCGLGTAESLRRAFLRTLHVSPTAYRQRFRGSR
jgi:transcriptional regulator GlxA family with amidase domain